MMHNTLVLDASPIILLGKTNLLSSVAPLPQSWIIPEQVVREVEAKRSITSYMSALNDESRVSRIEVKNIDPVIAAWDMGPGESAVLSLAVNKPQTRVVLDDLQARKCAALLDVPKIGSLGLIVAAKKEGCIKKAKPKIQRLIEAGLHIDCALLKAVYQKIGE